MLSSPEALLYSSGRVKDANEPLVRGGSFFERITGVKLCLPCVVPFYFCSSFCFVILEPLYLQNSSLLNPVSHVAVRDASLSPVSH